MTCRLPLVMLHPRSSRFPPQKRTFICKRLTIIFSFIINALQDFDPFFFKEAGLPFDSPALASGNHNGVGMFSQDPSQRHREPLSISTTFSQDWMPTSLLQFTFNTSELLAASQSLHVPDLFSSRRYVRLRRLQPRFLRSRIGFRSAARYGRGCLSRIRIRGACQR